MANADYLLVDVKGTFPPEPFTINAEERIGFASRLSRVTVGEHPVFTSNGEVSPIQRRILQNPKLTALIDAAHLREGESLHFFGNAITAYLIQPTEDRALAVIDRLISLAAEIEAPEADELDFSKLPTQFHLLIPLIRKWAIPDDQERIDFQESLPKQALQAFVDGVEPYLHSIDSYLDSFGDQPPTEEAAALGRLAECAVEVKRNLQASR